MTKKEKDLILTILIHYLKSKSTMMTREEYRTLSQLVDKLSKED